MVEKAMTLAGSVTAIELPEKPIMPSIADNLPDDEIFSSNKPIITIQTGAGEADKLYPAASWARVAGELISQDFQIVAIGAPGDPKIDQPEVIDRVGSWNLSEAIAAVGKSTLHLAADTGTGHIAAAYGVPVVSVFGRTDPAVFRPWTKQGIVLREGTTPNQTQPSSVVKAAKTLLEDRYAVCH